jgi:DNA repair exonuclease SbcCD ATPase subunit
LDAIQQKLQHYFELKNEVLTQQNKFEAVQKQAQQLEQRSKKTEQDYQAAKTEREKLQQVLQQQRLLHAENIEHLRAELKHGEACLVCGSTEHPYRDDESQISKAYMPCNNNKNYKRFNRNNSFSNFGKKLNNNSLKAILNKINCNSSCSN